MLKNVLTTLALAITVLPAAAKLPVIAEGVPCAMAQETVCAETVVTENGAPLSPEDGETAPPAPDFGKRRPHDHRHGEHRHEEHRHGHGEHRHGSCPHGSNDEKDGEHGRAPHGREDAVTLPCGIADLVIDRLTPEVIAVYERRIAGAPLLSEKSEAELSLAASELKLSVKKYEALVLLADIMARTSKPVPLSLLASLGDGELLRLARKHAKLYAASLTEEERDSLKDEFKATLKK